MAISWQSDIEDYDGCRWTDDMAVMRDLVRCGFIDLQTWVGEAYQVRYFKHGGSLLEPERMYPVRRKGSKCLWLKAEVRGDPGASRIVWAKFHKLVYLVHYGSIPYGHDVHHKDGDIWNNAVRNLEALPFGEHRKINRKTGVYDSLQNKPTISKDDKVVQEIFQLHASGLSIREVAKQVNLSNSTCRRIIKGIYQFKNGD